MGGAGAVSPEAVAGEGRVETDPAVFRDQHGGAGAEGCGGDQRQGQVEERAAAQGELRGLRELQPHPQMIHLIRAVVRRQGRGQALLEGGQLAEIVVAHQDQPPALLQQVDGAHQRVQAAGEQHHRLGPPGMGPGALKPQINRSRAGLEGPVVAGEEVQEAAQIGGESAPRVRSRQVEDDLPGPGVRGLPPGQQLVRGPDPQGRQEKGLSRLTGELRCSQQLRQVVVQGVAGPARLIQVDLRGHPRQVAGVFRRELSKKAGPLNRVPSFWFLVKRWKILPRFEVGSRPS